MSKTKPTATAAPAASGLGTLLRQYGCGPVAFTGTDDAGNIGSCTTAENVFVPTPTTGLSPALRVHKAAGMSPYTTCRLHWETAPPPQAWEHYEIRRTTTKAIRPYAWYYGDATFVGNSYIDTAATARLYFYQVYTVACDGTTAPAIMALSP